MIDEKIRLGTSAFTAAGWPGTFYPADLEPGDYLAYYSQHFDTVEIDSTWYRTPDPKTVKNWYAKTPGNFCFAAKIPQVITHERVLVGCEYDLKRFLSTMDALKEKLGPLLFQFPYFNKKAFSKPDEFLDRLEAFTGDLPSGYRFAVEIRNRGWIVPRLVEILGEHNIALALIDHSWMPRPDEIFERLDPITADFTYIRWLGDRKGIEEQTKTWDKTIIDRSRELQEWVDICRELVGRGVSIFAFANNHYAGHSPATVRLFEELWQQKSE